MPLITCEMRWFLEGVPPAAVEEWFAAGRPRAEPWREDRYLILPGVADMGIKAREGRLEIKGRTAVLGTHAIAPGIEGIAERWCKWSNDMAFAEHLCGPSNQQSIVVGKERVQRHFLLERWAQETAERAPDRRGFSLELTRIRLTKDAYWSLGIKAAPANDPTLLVDLLRAQRDVLQGFPLPPPQARSHSYPRWLSDLASTARGAN
jgi:hypothetical protein